MFPLMIGNSRMKISSVGIPIGNPDLFPFPYDSRMIIKKFGRDSDRESRSIPVPHSRIFSTGSRPVPHSNMDSYNDARHEEDGRKINIHSWKSLLINDLVWFVSLYVTLGFVRKNKSIDGSGILTSVIWVILVNKNLVDVSFRNYLFKHPGCRLNRQQMGFCVSFIYVAADLNFTLIFFLIKETAETTSATGGELFTVDRILHPRTWRYTKNFYNW
jgi:hypothetical protein